MRTEYIYFFFFNDTATTEIYTLSLHDALPIYSIADHSGFMFSYIVPLLAMCYMLAYGLWGYKNVNKEDRKSTRLNSSHANISYAVFCLKKKYNIIYLLLILSLT